MLNGRIRRSAARSRVNMAAGASAMPKPDAAVAVVSTELSKTGPRRGGQGACFLEPSRPLIGPVGAQQGLADQG